MDKEVYITIRSTQRVDGCVAEGPELLARGTYRYAPEMIRVSYLDSEAPGVRETRNVFTIRPGEVVLSRKGMTNTRMVFHPGEYRSFCLHTEMGMMNLGLDTRRLNCAMGEQGGSMEIEYDIGFPHAVLSRNTFEVSIQPISAATAATEKGITS